MQVEPTLDRLWSGYAGAVAGLALNLLFVVAVLLLVAFLFAVGLGYRPGLSLATGDEEIKSAAAIAADVQQLRADNEMLREQLLQARQESEHHRLAAARAQRALRKLVAQQAAQAGDNSVVGLPAKGVSVPHKSEHGE